MKPIKSYHIKAIAQVFCIWAIITLIYFLIVKFVWS